MNSLASPPSAPSFHHPNAAGNPFAHPIQQQQQQQPGGQGNFGYAGQSLGYGAGNGARPPSMPPGRTMQGHSPQPQQSYAPSQPIPPQQHFLQQQQHPIRPSASPPNHQQPYRASPPNASSSNPTPPKQYPMAAPPLPNTPSNTANTNPTASSPPKTPLSPTSASLEANRIAHLLHLNSALLSEISTLQSAGHGGVLNPAQAEAARQKGLPEKMASEDYIHTMRRVQANLQYLMTKNPAQQGEGAKQLPGPAIMTPPPHLGARLRREYERLRELFPEWMGIEGRSAAGGTPGRQGSGSGGTMGGQQMPQQPQQH